MAISFNSIPSNLRIPGVFTEVDNSRALQGLAQINEIILITGQQLAAGSATEGDLNLVSSADQADGLYGVGSMLASMIRAAKTANPFTEMWAIPLDDAGAAVAATGTIAITGPATADGTLALLIDGVKVPVAVSDTDSATDIGDAVVTAVTANTRLPVTAANVTGTVTFTAKQKGENGNDIDVRVNYFIGEALPAGVGETIVAIGDVVAGATNPDIATAITSMGDNEFNHIISAWTDASNMVALEAEMLRRDGPLVQQQGMAYTGKRGTASALTTYGNSRNSQFVTNIGVGSLLGAMPNRPEIWASIYGAVIAFYGNINVSRPFQTLIMTGLLPPPEAERFTKGERNTLLFDGISTYTVDTGGLIRIERAITTYQTNAQAVQDDSFLNVNSMLQLSFIRKQVIIRITNRFPRHSLADDGTNISPDTQAVATPKQIRDELIALASLMEVQGVIENLETFKTALVVERDLSDRDRVNVLLPPDLVNQYRVTAINIQFIK